MGSLLLFAEWKKMGNGLIMIMKMFQNAQLKMFIIKESNIFYFITKFNLKIIYYNRYLLLYINCDLEK